MRITAALLSSAFLFLAAPVQADDACCESPATKIEQKLKEIDLSILLKQYEEIQSTRAKTEVALMLLQTEPSSDEREKQVSILQERVNRLSLFAGNLRDRILETGKALAAISH